tara:strand:- start:6481 stop:7905 length:1425 start_codon:yes stop_codon:yes gene_type:complete
MKLSVKKSTHKTKFQFDIANISVPFANTLRRTFSTLCPTISFSPTNPDSIRIEENSGALHNEFLKQRIGLIPILMDNANTKGDLTLRTSYDPTTAVDIDGFETARREWSFVSTDVPTFTLEEGSMVRPPGESRKMRDITTHNFKPHFADPTKVRAIVNYFRTDPYTDEAVLITCLNYTSLNYSASEKLNITCSLVPNLGKYHSSHDPTGAVEYSFQLPTDEILTSHFEAKFEHLNNERIGAGSAEYSESEKVQLRDNFDRLDKYRFFKTDDDGQANVFNYAVESIGFMSSENIVLNSMKVLELALADIMASIHIRVDDNTPVIEKYYSPKIKYMDLEEHNVNDGMRIKITDENHTLGNIIQHTIRKMYLKGMGEEDVLKLANYKMNHPAVEEIEIYMSLHDTVTESDMDTFITKALSAHTDITAANLDISSENKPALMYVSILLNALSKIKSDVKKLLAQFQTKQVGELLFVER